MKWHHGGFPSLKRGFDSRRPLMEEDHGSTRSFASALLQLVGGVLIGSAIVLARADGIDNPMSIGFGGLAALYFTVSGSVRLVLAVLTRRAQK